MKNLSPPGRKSSELGIKAAGRLALTVITLYSGVMFYISIHHFFIQIKDKVKMACTYHLIHVVGVTKKAEYTEPSHMQL